MDSLTEEVDPAFLRAQHRLGQTLLGKWHLDSLLGVGGMAAVYSGTHRNESRAAIKILHPELTVRPEIRKRFFREGRAANRVDHPGVVKVIDEDETDQGELFLVMELLGGESLEARAARIGGKLPADEVLSIADQILDVLVAAHEKNVLHRDLKPENVFLTRAGQVKVLDFGIARLRQVSEATHATKTGSSMGTPAYMPPEQARGLWAEVDARSDLWAVGATMFTLLRGRPVHGGRTTNEVLVAACTKPADGLRTVMPEVRQPVAEVVDRALAFEKEERWPDAKAMQSAVRRAFEEIHRAPLSTAPKLTVPESVKDRTLASAGAPAATDVPVTNGRSLVRTVASLSRPALLGGVGVVVAVLVAVMVIARGSSGPEPEPASAAASVATGEGETAERSEPTVEAVAPSPDAGAASDAVSVEELPTEPATEKPTSPAQRKPLAKPEEPYTGNKVAPPKPTPAPPPKPPSAMDQREW